MNFYLKLSHKKLQNILSRNVIYDQSSSRNIFWLKKIFLTSIYQGQVVNNNCIYGLPQKDS